MRRRYTIGLLAQEEDPSGAQPPEEDEQKPPIAPWELEINKVTEKVSDMREKGGEMPVPEQEEEK